MRSACRDAVLLEIPLVIFFGTPKIGRRNDLRHDLAREASGPVEFVFHLLRRSFLLRIMKEDNRAILLAIVGTLAVQSGGVVCIEENTQQFFVGNLRGI